MGDAGPGSPPRRARPPRSGLHPGQPAATAGQRGAPGVWRARGSLEWVQLELLLRQRRKLRHRGAGVDRGRDWVSHFWLLIRAPPATSLLPRPLLQREPRASGSKGPSRRPEQPARPERGRRARWLREAAQGHLSWSRERPADADHPGDRCTVPAGRERPAEALQKPALQSTLLISSCPPPPSGVAVRITTRCWSRLGTRCCSQQHAVNWVCTAALRGGPGAPAVRLRKPGRALCGPTPVTLSRPPERWWPLPLPSWTGCLAGPGRPAHEGTESREGSGAWDEPPRLPRPGGGSPNCGAGATGGS